MDWARILAYVTGTVDQELLARNEYLATENRILKDRLKGLGRRASHARRDWSSPGSQGSRRGRNRRPAGHDPGLVPQAGRP
jgi:putative transposase